MISIARAFPTSRDKRAVPPVPANTPSATSGKPIWKLPFNAIRISAAMAISNPPPTVCPFSAAITNFGVCSKRDKVSFACKQKKYLYRGDTLFRYLMLAPAEKNFSPCPVNKITETSSSNLAFRIALSMSSHISRV